MLKAAAYLVFGSKPVARKRIKEQNFAYKKIPNKRVNQTAGSSVALVAPKFSGRRWLPLALAEKEDEMFDDNFGLTTAQILRKISTQLGVDYDGGEIKVTRDGREYLMFIYLPVRGGGQANLVGSPSFFEMKTKIPYSHPFFGIRKSNSIDWVAEHVLSMPDYQVGDTDFDTQFYIKVKEKDWASQFFSNNCIKGGISDLLLQGFDLIRSEEGNLKAVKYLALGGPYPTVEMINNAIKQLDQIISNFPDDYVCVDLERQNDKESSNYQIAKEANIELLYGSMDEKSKQRASLLLVLLVIVFAIALWRLFTNDNFASFIP